MKAWLVLQEGPGAGRTFALDPAQKLKISAGRSSECDLVLEDHRASRHHTDFRWNGRQWEVVDHGSTNGTYVNGLQVHKPYELRVGDRITIGETTMVLRESSGRQAAPAQGAAARDAARTAERAVLPGAPLARPAASRSPAEAQPSTAAQVAFWLTQGIVILAVICLASGALLPWFEISASLSQGDQSLLQNLANLVASFSGQGSIFGFSRRIGGLEGYGALTLAIAAISTIALVVDLFFYRKSVVPGIVYLGSGLLASAAIGFDLINYYRQFDNIRQLSVLFGIDWNDIMQFVDRFIDFRVDLMVGLYLTVAGLLLLLVGGTGRIVASFLNRRQGDV